MFFYEGPDQAELFGGHAREKRKWLVNADTVCEKMQLMLDTARSAETTPWPPRKAKSTKPSFRRWQTGCQMMSAIRVVSRSLRKWRD